MDNIILVPWFSRNEWLDVYKNVFETDLQNWRHALDIISVWISRVPKVSMGIEATTVLLDARVMVENYNQLNTFNKEDSSQYYIPLRNRLLGNAIVSFVGTVIKSCENKFFYKQPQAYLADMVNLPSYLVHLRNDLVHSNSDISSQKINEAFSDCLKWIKEHYWDKEYEYMQSQHKTFTPVEKPMVISSHLEENAHIYLKVGNQKNHDELYLRKSIIKELHHYCSSNKEHCAEVIIKLFILPLVKDFETDIDNLKEYSYNAMKNKVDLEKIEFIFNFIQCNSLEADVLCCLVNSVQNPEIVLILFRKIRPKPEDFTEVVKAMLFRNRNSFSEIALRLMAQDNNNFTPEQCKEVSKVLQILNHEITNLPEIADNENSSNSNTIYTLDMLKREDNKVELPLGIISKDQNYPDFYKELIIKI